MTAAAAMVREEAFAFGCEGQTLLGILHHPAAAGGAAQAARTGVVVIVGGPQYRAGSHRQFVHLARALAAAGHPVLRFDVRGMGDSSGALHDFEQITPDIGAAIDALIERVPGVRNVALWGLCDGASAALLYLHERRDARVHGLCLLNPWVRSEASLARTHVKHYYARRLREREFWLKLLSGGVAAGALAGLIRNLRLTRQGAGAAVHAAAFQDRMASAWAAFEGRILLVLSGEDYTAREFEEYVATASPWAGLLAAARVGRHELADADHTFSSARHRGEVAQATAQWLAGLAPPRPVAAGRSNAAIGVGGHA